MNGSGTEPITAFLLVGGSGQTPVEQTVGAAHHAAARDLLETWAQVDGIGRVIVATDDAAWCTGADFASLPIEVDVDPPRRRFHFGQRLTALIERCQAHRVLYSGGGSAPLMHVHQWQTVIHRLQQERHAHVVVTNNVHSCDWIAFTDAPDALPIIAPETSDNGLAWLLAEQGHGGKKWEVESLPPTASARFDLDTPMDLLIAQRHPLIGRHLQRFLERTGWSAPQLDGVLDVMAQEGGRLAVIGRVSAAAWGALERATRCWVRVFAEERGMRASGRQAQGAVRSLVSDYVDVIGIEAFFDQLDGLVDGVLWDNRVVLAAHQLWPPAAARFDADLLRWDLVEEPFLRRFTQAAAQARVPVVLGGHSVVAGGLMALVEAFESGSGTRIHTDSH
jgi:hypothetical protein